MARRTKSKKKKDQERQKRRIERDAPPEETRAAEAVTVFWLLTGFATFIAEITWVALRFTGDLFADKEKWLAISTIVFVIAFCSGIMALILTPVASKLRKLRPPKSITYSAILVGTLPILLLVVSFVIG